MRYPTPRGWWSHASEADYQMFQHYGRPYLPGAWRATFHLDDNCAELLNAPFSQPTTFPGTAKTCDSCGQQPPSAGLGQFRVEALHG
jgi:hypothetical protein